MNREARIVNLNDFDETCQDDAIVTLQMLVGMHNESHRIWRITPSNGGAWDYVKA